MARLNLGNGRFIHLPNRIPVCDLATPVVGEPDEFMLLFAQDDGKNVKLLSLVAIPIEQAAGFVKAVVESARVLKLDWESLESNPQPLRFDPAH